MFDLIRKTMLAGVGFTIVTKDKVEQLIGEYIKKGEMTEKEGKKLLNEFMKKSELARKDLEKRLEEMIKKALKKMNIATVDDIKRLDRKITVTTKKSPASGQKGRFRKTRS